MATILTPSSFKIFSKWSLTGPWAGSEVWKFLKLTKILLAVSASPSFAVTLNSVISGLKFANQKWRGIKSLRVYSLINGKMKIGKTNFDLFAVILFLKKKCVDRVISQSVFKYLKQNLKALLKAPLKAALILYMTNATE